MLNKILVYCIIRKKSSQTKKFSRITIVTEGLKSGMKSHIVKHNIF